MGSETRIVWSTRIGTTGLPASQQATTSSDTTLAVPETASFNKSKRFARLGVKYKTDWLLKRRCLDLASGATGTSSKLWQEVHPYYSASAFAKVVTDCDTAIAAIEGGCASI